MFVNVVECPPVAEGRDAEFRAHFSTGVLASERLANRGLRVLSEKGGRHAATL
jgi:hypothetical protein